MTARDCQALRCREAGAGQTSKRTGGSSPEARQADLLEAWLMEQLGQISRKSPLAKAIKYALTRLPKARPRLEYGFLELDNNTAERTIRPVTLGRKNYLFMGSEAGGHSAAVLYTLIETAKLNKVKASWTGKYLKSVLNK